MIVSEINEELLSKGLASINSALARSVNKGKISKQDMDAILGRIKGTTNVDDFADCDLVIEAVVENLEIKKKVRYELGIAKKRTVFLATGNFIPRKQLDRLIEVFQKLSDRDDFFLIIAGHGDKHNTARLKSLISGLAKQGKAILHPYVTGEALRNLYWASDIYVSVAIDEGTPVSVAKAMACGLPVLSTPVGETSELMKKHDVGMFVPVRRYDKWVKAIREILEHGPPPALDINIARQSYHLPNVARRLIRIYDYLYDTYYGTKSS